MATISYGADGAPVNDHVPVRPSLPDLQRLVTEAGRWDLIAAATWFKFDNDVARYRAARVKQLRDEQDRNADRVRIGRTRRGARK